MKFLLPLLFLVPTFSFGAAVPHWYQQSGVSFYSNSYYVASTTNPWIYLTNLGVKTGALVTGPVWSVYTCIPTAICEFLPDDAITGENALSSDYYVTTALSTADPSSFTDPLDFFATPWGTSGDSVYADAVERSENYCNYGTSNCPTTVYKAMYLRPKATPTDNTTFILLGYWKLTLFSGSFGSLPIYTVSSDTQPAIFPAYNGPGSPEAIAFSLKEAIHANTVLPDCDFSELFESAFWSECVARSIINWLFIPSDDAIDVLVDISANPQFGVTWSYVVLAPIYTSTLVSGCSLDSPETCDIGADHLTIPILDVHGSSTPYVLNPEPFVAPYFDAFLASIVQSLIIVMLSYALISKLL